MLDENEAGRAGREDIACRLSKHCFVKVHVFDKPDTEPEHLTSGDLWKYWKLRHERHPEQGELFGLVLERRHPFRLCANDIVRIGGRLGLIIRVNECAAVVLMNGG